jgi:4-amino-4-deoxy-L-arabinose transferase-like glycosyltransferase
MNGRRTDRIAVVLSIAMFLVYLSTLSVSLDEEDSVHFALGLREFNVTEYQPHPPGFPVYIAIGMLFNTLLMNEILSLTLMSALSGALSLFVFYLLAREMFEGEIALAASALAAFTPLFWLNSVKALSDMTGLLFTLLPMLFIYRYIRSGKPLNLYAGAILAGISAGIRIHSLLVLVPMLVYGSFSHGKNAHTKLRAWLLFTISVLAWLLPLIAVTGINEYFSVAGSQLLYRVDRPDISLLGTGLAPGYVGLRLLSFPYFFLFGGYGINLAGLGVLSAVLLLLMAALVAIPARRARLRDSRLIFFATGILVYLAAVFILLPPSNPRYLLMLVPILSLVLAAGIWRIRKPGLRYIVFGAMALLMLSHSVFLAYEIRTIPAPPIQLINYVNENYVPEDAMFSAGFMDKYLDYYGTNLTRLPAGTGCGSVEELVSENRSVLTVSGSGRCDGLTPIEIARFSRDPRVHVKRSTAILYEFLPEQEA